MSILNLSNIQLSNDSSIDTKISHLITQIKTQPTDNNLRLALIQYYCLSSNWKKALNTTNNYLKINTNDNNSKVLLAHNITAEIQRNKVLTGSLDATMYEACNEEIFIKQNLILQHYLTKTDVTNVFMETITLVDDIAHNHDFKTQDKNLSGLWLDSDLRTTFILETFIEGKYYWIPLINITKIIFKDTEYLTDILWRRGEIFLTDGRIVPAFVPARYVVTDHEIDDQLKLCQKTDWQAYDKLHVANGQKVFTNGTEDVSILDLLVVNKTD